MAKAKNAKPKLIEAAMKIAAGKGWGAVTVKSMAARAKVSEANARKIFAKPTDVLLALIEIADAAMATDTVEGTPREKLFELTLRRFDALQNYRAGLAALESDKAVWPSLAPALMPSLLQSSRQMLAGAGVPDDGLRALVWLAVKADVARVWFADEGADLSKTMAALDRRLGQIERAAQVLSPFCR